MVRKVLNHGKRKFSGAIAVIALMVVLTTVYNVFATTPTTLNVGGASTIYPISKAAATNIMKANPSIAITVFNTDSSVGVIKVANGTFDIGGYVGNLTAQEVAKYKGLVSTKIGIDGIIVIMNKTNKINNLSKQQVINIFTGKVTNWNQLGGENAKIGVNTREAGAGTLSTFQELALGGAAIVSSAKVNTTLASMKQSITNDVNAIGFIPLSFTDSTVKAVNIENIQPTQKNVAEKKWPYIVPLNYITKGTPTGNKKIFIDYVLSSTGQALVKSLGFVPIK